MLKTREDDLESALLFKLHERLSPADVRLLEHCWARRDLDLIVHPPLSAHQAVWLVHFKLLSTRVDRADRIWIETTPRGRDLVLHIRRLAAARRTVSP